MYDTTSLLYWDRSENLILLALKVSISNDLILKGDHLYLLLLQLVLLS